MSLGARLTLLLIGPLVLSLLVSGVLIVRSASLSVKREIAASVNVAELLVQARLKEMREESESEARLDALANFLSNDPHLHVTVSADGALAASRMGGQTAEQRGHWFSWLLGVHPETIEIPVENAADAPMRIVITTDPDGEIRKAGEASVIDLLTVIAFGVSAMFLVYVGLSRSLRPLTRLSAALARVGQGDYSARVGASGAREIAVLGSQFDAMAGQLQEMRSRTQALTAQVLAVQERERRELARDLHDELGPCLLAANLDVATLLRLNRTGQSSAVRDCAEGLDGLIRRMQDQVRSLIGRLRLDEPALFDLGAAIGELADFWRERCPALTCQVAEAERWNSLPPPWGRPVFLMVQEGISNAVRHSGATTITVTVAFSDAGAQIAVADDGHGFTQGAKPGYGLCGMRERLATIGGSVDVTTTAGQGTTLVARLPAPPGSARLGSAEGLSERLTGTSA
ncbi:sensor histidine kinase [Aliidongia dinghuensis]|uniref:Sensor histidine kinase n=2 Tax=Aliidongia dinghuensis TaxID=1867774 RepID=A0A8J2YRT0_9PROT|nr:sensor histidine kinase [Aliidongia dinghuensis]